MKKTYCILACILLLVSTSSLWGQSHQSDSIYSLGVAHYNSGKYDKAIDCFSLSNKLDHAELDSLSPRRDYSSQWLANCYHKLGDDETAKKYNKETYMFVPVDRRKTIQSDRLIAEAINDLSSNRCSLALNELKEASTIEHQLFDNDHYFHIGTYRMMAQCNICLQQMDNALDCMVESARLIRVNHGLLDTLLLNDLNPMYYINLNLHRYDEAKKINEEIANIINSNFNNRHGGYAEVAYRNITLLLLQRKWGDAHKALPEYIETLERCFGDNPDILQRAISTIRNDFNNCGRTSEIEYLDSIADCITMRISPIMHFNALVLKYSNHMQSKDFENLIKTENDINNLLAGFPSDSLQEQRAAFACMRCVSLVVTGKLEEAKDAFIKIQKDSLEQRMSKDGIFYPTYLGTKAAICTILMDFEGCLDACTKFVEKQDTQQKIQNLNISALMACMHAFSGNYQKARAKSQETIKLYEEHVIDNKSLFRLEKDTMQVREVIEMIQNYIVNIGHLPDSATYALRDIKCDFLLLKAKLLKNTRRYQLNNDYYECISDYAFELVKMRKYIEAQEVMDNYLAEWYDCYNQIEEKSQVEDDIWDRLLGKLTLGEALDFRRRKCYEKGDPAGIKAYKDYIEYVIEESGENSDDYFNAMVNYYEFIDDNTSLLKYLSSAIDANPNDYSPYAYQLAAETYAKENQPELSIKYRKGYIAVCLRDSISRNENEYEILHTIYNINRYYTQEVKDTTAMLHYYQNELWPSFDICDDLYIDYFIRSIDKLCYEMDDNSFISYVDNEMKRKKVCFDSPIIRGCVYQVIAGVLLRGSNKKDMAIDYMKRACDAVKADSVLSLLFSCQLHKVMSSCSSDSCLNSNISYGYELMKIFEQKPTMKYTREYVALLESQIELLQKANLSDKIVELCQSYLKDFSNRDEDDLSEILNSNYAGYQKVSFINHTNLRASSWGVSRTVHNALYSALSIIAPHTSGDYAMSLVHDEYKSLRTSLEVNSVSSWQCDDLISLTSKLAYKHKTDSLRIYAYDTSLLCKGLQLRSTHAIRAIIKQSGHKSALRKYDELQYTLHLITNAAEDKLDSLQKRRESLEKDLFRLSVYFGDYKKSLYKSWKDVQSGLTEDDIAIEFTLVKKDYDDKYVRHDRTFNEGYYACILKKGMAIPDIVFICETDSIDVSPSIYNNINMTCRLMTPLNPFLKGVKNIYFSPIGKLNQLSIESLPLQEDSTKTLSQKYNIYRLSSTQDLVSSNYPIIGTNAVVYGGLAYDATIDVMETDAKNYTENKTRDIKFDITIDIKGLRSVVVDIPYLAGTKTEAEDVSYIINSAKDSLLVAQIIEGTKGTEASFKSLGGQKKRIIHLATHGFYFSKEESDKVQSMTGKDIQKLRGEDQSLMRSGLFMTGAENRYQGDVIPEGIEDGILTAQEIANTDLSGLDLCVLSACQTAQGDISSEGVFGLQRGFKKAGAQSILMSLWKVDDEATCLLMTEFYRNWIGEKMNKRDSLEKAKQAVRSHKEKGWDDPKYWAAFILLDALD